MNFRMALLLATLAGLAAVTAPARAEDGFFSRVGRALDRGVVRGRELVAEGAEGAGRGLQRAGEATGRAAERVGRSLRPDETPAPTPRPGQPPGVAAPEASPLPPLR